MLTLPYYMQSLKWAVPAAVMLGSSPSFYVMWGGWRLLTLVMPSRVYETGDDFFYSLYQRLILFFYEHYTGVEVVLHGEVDRLLKKKENVILLLNHQSTVDWIVADILAVRQGSIGHIRYILKDGLKYFPLYGFYFRQHSCIYVKRGGKFQQEKTEKQLDLITKKNTPFWMVVFPEGTRYNPDNPQVIAKSREYAKEQGIAPLDNLLTPRVKAVQLCIERLRETADAVYDVTVGYSDTTQLQTKARLPAPGLPDFLQGASKQLHLHISCIDMKDVPRDGNMIKDWLLKRYQEKDRLMARFYSQDRDTGGTLSDSGRVDRLSLKHTLPALALFTTVNAALLATKEGRSIYWKAAVVGIVTGWIWMTIRT